MNLSNKERETLTHLLDLLKDEEVGEIEVENKAFGGWRVRVAKKGAGSGSFAVPFPVQGSSGAAQAAESSTAAPGGTTITTGDQVAGTPVKSPMVGTFYRSPSPDSEVFVKEGDIVSPGQTLCIIEAMKIMNEIEAEEGGRIVQVLVEDGKPVEYNTNLFLIEPA